MKTIARYWTVWQTFDPIARVIFYALLTVWLAAVAFTVSVYW